MNDPIEEIKSTSQDVHGDYLTCKSEKVSLKLAWMLQSFDNSSISYP